MTDIDPAVLPMVAAKLRDLGANDPEARKLADEIDPDGRSLATIIADAEASDLGPLAVMARVLQVIEDRLPRLIEARRENGMRVEAVALDDLRALLRPETSDDKDD